MKLTPKIPPKDNQLACLVILKCNSLWGKHTQVFLLLVPNEDSKGLGKIWLATLLNGKLDQTF